MMILKITTRGKKKYISDYIDDLSDALSNLADFASTTASLSADQISKISDTLIQALAKLNNIKNKTKTNPNNHLYKIKNKLFFRFSYSKLL